MLHVLYVLHILFSCDVLVLLHTTKERQGSKDSYTHTRAYIHATSPNRWQISVENRNVYMGTFCLCIQCLFAITSIKEDMHFSSLLNLQQHNNRLHTIKVYHDWCKIIYMKWNVFHTSLCMWCLVFLWVCIWSILTPQKVALINCTVLRIPVWVYAQKYIADMTKRWWCVLHYMVLFSSFFT